MILFPVSPLQKVKKECRSHLRPPGNLLVLHLKREGRLVVLLRPMNSCASSSKTNKQQESQDISFTFSVARPVENAVDRRGAQSAQQREKNPHFCARISPPARPHTITNPAGSQVPSKCPCEQAARSGPVRSGAAHGAASGPPSSCCPWDPLLWNQPPSSPCSARCTEEILLGVKIKSAWIYKQYTTSCRAREVPLFIRFNVFFNKTQPCARYRRVWILLTV